MTKAIELENVGRLALTRGAGSRTDAAADGGRSLSPWLASTVEQTRATRFYRALFLAIRAGTRPTALR